MVAVFLAEIYEEFLLKFSMFKIIHSTMTLPMYIYAFLNFKEEI